MNQNPPSKQSKQGPFSKLKLPISILAILIVLTLVIGSLVRAGVIPNFTGLDFLDPQTGGWPTGQVDYKPVIYLYPEKEQDIQVQLDYKGELIATYPEYNKSSGWNVAAQPDGTLTNKADNQEYSYLFWEGQIEKERKWSLETGYIVKGKEAREFLQKTLSQMGLTPKEYNEFIVFWYPQIQNNPYNLIHFANEQYTDTATLKINPQPDSMLRVFMVVKPLTKPIPIENPTIEPFEREGFTVVEWGGTITN